MSQKRADQPIKSLQSHLKMMLSVVKAQASTRQVRQLPHAIDTIERQIAQVTSIKHYRLVAKKITEDAARIFGVNVKKMEPEIDSVALSHYWLTSGRQIKPIETHYGQLSPARRFTLAQCYDFLRVFSANAKDKPAWMDGMSRSSLMVIKQGILGAIAPILPLQPEDLNQFWSEVEILLKTWRADDIIKILRGKKIRINHQYRQNGGNNIQYMLDLIQRSGFSDAQSAQIVTAVATAANVYIDEERLNKIWASTALRERLQTVISLSMGYKPLFVNTTPGLQNVWWFEGSKVRLRGMLCGHPVPEGILEHSEKVRQTQLNIEQIWEIIAPPAPERGQGGLVVPVIIQSLQAPCWPDVDGTMDRSALLEGAVKQMGEAQREKGSGHHQADMWVVNRPVGGHAALSTVTPDKRFRQLIGQKAILGTQLWAEGSVEYTLLLAAASRYEALHDEVFAMLRRYQSPIVGTVISRLAYLNKSQALKEKMMLLVSLEQIIIGLSDGICVSVCEDGLEKSLACMVHTHAVLAFYERHNTLPNLNSQQDKKRLANLFVQILKSQWPQQLAYDANPGKRVLPCIDDLPAYLIKGFKRRQDDWLRNHRLRLKLPFVSQPHHPAPMPWLTMLPSTFDLHGACHVANLLPSVPALRPLPEHMPALLLLNASTRAGSGAGTDVPPNQRLSTTEPHRPGMSL